MSVATVSSKGQITIPARARRAAGIKLRDRVLIEPVGGEIVIRPIRGIMELEGFLGRALSPARERQAMSRAVAKHVRRRP
jgi:AbrB family looped-hinge helix DNA binding protein